MIRRAKQVAAASAGIAAFLWLARALALICSGHLLAAR